jgi:hypothetical protein
MMAIGCEANKSGNVFCVFHRLQTNYDVENIITSPTNFVDVSTIENANLSQSHFFMNNNRLFLFIILYLEILLG